MPLTPSQQRAVDCTGRPLFIQAGAGTGKTYTLTQRLAQGLSTGAIPAVDNLLTITFTNKAAGELLGRVRAELRTRGMKEEALQVDAAWISTIHSMCQRVLKTNAFDAGIDPGVEMLDEMESDALLSRAIDEMLEQRGHEQNVRQLESSMGGVGKMCSMLRKVIGLFSGVARASLSFDPGPQPQTGAAELLAMVHRAACDERDALEGLGAAAAGKTAAAALAAACANVDALQEALGAEACNDMQLDAWARSCEVIAALDVKPRRGLKKEPWRSIIDDWVERASELSLSARAALLHLQTLVLLDLAEDAHARHRALKRALGSVDMGDILVATYHLLDERPDIARRYEERFASVMIDEFQDTDRLQVAIVKHLCDEHLSTLATVGDAQQSIYGFRGADLAVYYEMREEMKRLGAENVALATNFRSHSGILQFVEAVFSTPQFFGEEFLKIGPGPSNDRAHDWIATDAPRVHLELVAGPDAEGKEAKLGQLRAGEAQVIARKFAELHAAGADYGQMAVLLRSMSNVSLYEEAFAALGIPCIISGGSLFLTSDEVGTLVMLLRFIENRDDDEALFNLLASPLFDIDDDGLLALADFRATLRPKSESVRVRVSLYAALCQRVRKMGEGALQQGVPAQSNELLARAHAVLSAVLEQSRSKTFSSVVLGAVAVSGWRAGLAQQGIDGAAGMANIQHFCDLLDDAEAHMGHSAVRVAEYFRSMRDDALDGGRDGKPGAMVMRSQGAVQIMTFHASKGLEFPIVAVAEYDRAPFPSTLWSVSEDGKNYLTLAPSKGSADFSSVSEEEDCGSFAQARSPRAFISHAGKLAVEGELQEAQRLLYVALTRAKDLLVVMGHDKGYLSKNELAQTQFAAMIGAAIGDQSPADGSVVRTRTGALVAFNVTPVPEEPAGQEPGTAAKETKHLLQPIPQAPCVRARLERRPELYSYSLLAQGAARADADLVPSMVQLRHRDDAETVSTVGSAFHLAMQWLVEQLRTGRMMPEEVADAASFASCLERVACRYALNDEELGRLRSMASAWVASGLFARALRYRRLCPEHAFLVDVAGIPLEGYIDLLCCGSDDGSALIIDYKTGTSGAPEELRDRYALQAACYAYAVLAAGVCTDAELVFVRPEVDMQQLSYSYTQGDLESLASFIVEHAQEGQSE